MLEIVAKYTLVLFGCFLAYSGVYMLARPVGFRNVISKAASTNLINYTEITLRLIPATAFVLYAESTVYSVAFKFVGWAMIITSGILYLVPRKWHQKYALKCAEILKPVLLRLIAPVSIGLGVFIFFVALRSSN